MPAIETDQPLAAPFWPGHTAVIRPVKIKTIVQRESRQWMQLNEWADRGHFSDGTHNMSQRVLI
jgi:hypothetical protein